MKRTLRQFSQTLTVITSLLLAAPAAAFAATAEACTKAHFFGLVPWYQYLRLNGNCDIEKFMILPNDGAHSDIPLVLLAVIDDLLRIAGLVAVGYIIYGGIQYIVSQGSPDGTNKAKGTILNALIGLALAVVSISIVSFIGKELGGA